MSDKPASGLWRKNPETPEGKYLVKRRDGSIPPWPNFVMGAADPCVPPTLRKYAEEAEKHGYNPQYVQDVRDLADEFDRYREAHGEGDPDRGRHRTDDPAIVEEMKKGRSS